MPTAESEAGFHHRLENPVVAAIQVVWAKVLVYLVEIA
jgi:hypothetical protein